MTTVSRRHLYRSLLNKQDHRQEDWELVCILHCVPQGWTSARSIALWHKRGSFSCRTHVVKGFRDFLADWRNANEKQEGKNRFQRSLIVFSQVREKTFRRAKILRPDRSRERWRHLICNRERQGLQNIPCPVSRWWEAAVTIAPT